MITLIAAHDEQGLIGAQGAMPWNIKSEMAHFRKTTAGHAVLMEIGRASCRERV